MEQGEPALVKSMTGYGRGEAVVHGRSITVELRSVNNRYLDCTIKLPRIYVFAEDAIKSKVQAHISRGKVDVFVTIGPSENGDVSISVNKPVADGYYAALCALPGPGCLPGREDPGGSGGRERGHLLRAGAGPSGL